MTIEPMTLAVVVAALAVVVIAAIVWATFVLDRRPSAGGTVELYLQAIASGDAITANGLFNPESIGPEHLPTQLNDTTSFTSEKALAAAIERISDIQIVRVGSTARSDIAVVFCRYSLADQSLENGFSLRWERGRWRLNTGLWQILQIRPSFDEARAPDATVIVKLGGASATTTGSFSEFGSFLAYPGVYPISLDAPGWTIEQPWDSVGEVRLVAPNSACVVRPRLSRA